MPEKKKKPQLHQSHLQMLYRCGWKFAKVVIDGEKEPPTTPLVVGTATHVTVAKNLESKISKGTLMTREAVQDFARDDFLIEWNKVPVVLNEDERFAGLQKTRDSLQDQTVRLVTAHHYDIAPVIRPKAVERKWVLETTDDLRFDLAGMIDVDEGAGIRDTKTRKTNLGQKEVETSEQYTMYALAKWILDGQIPQYVIQDNIVKPSKTRDAYVVSYQSTRTKDDFDVLYRRIQQAEKIITAGAYTPANPSDWWCSKEFCGFAAAGSCPFYNSKRNNGSSRKAGNSDDNVFRRTEQQNCVSARGKNNKDNTTLKQEEKNEQGIIESLTRTLSAEK